MRIILGILLVFMIQIVTSQDGFNFNTFNFPDPASNANQNQPAGQSNGFNQMNAQMPPVQGPQPQLTGVQFSGQATNPATNTLTGSVSGQQQAVNSFGPASTGFGQNANFGQLQPSNSITSTAQKLTPEQQWLTVGGSRMSQNSNPTLNGNLNNGIPFSSLGFNPNNPTQFQPLNQNRGRGQFSNGPLLNQMPPQNQMGRGMLNPRQGPQGGPRQQNRGFSNQFENFGTPGNDFMSFNVGAMGPPPEDFSAFGGRSPNGGQNMGTMGPNSLFGGPEGGMFGGGGGPGGMFGGPDGPGFSSPGGFDSMGLPPFVRRSMGMGFMGGPGPSFGGFQPMNSFVGPFGK